MFDSFDSYSMIKLFSCVSLLLLAHTSPSASLSYPTVKLRTNKEINK